MPLTSISKFWVIYMFSSESVALECLGYKIERDVKPGEAIFVDLSVSNVTH